jgi:Flp pilus assembly protein TadD
VSERLESLRAMVAEDPADLLARYLLGKECLNAGLLDEAVIHLRHYVDRFAGDRGAAYGALASALEQRGRLSEARDALRLGLVNAQSHRHLQLAADLTEALERLPAE